MSDERYVSLTFDDGLLAGAHLAAELLAPFGGHASFFVVTGWIEPSTVTIRDACNIGRDHGTWDDWRSFAALGHEVGSHTRSHLKATSWRARLDPWRLRREVGDSYRDLERELGVAPVSIAMPYDVMTPQAQRAASSRYEAVRLGHPVAQYHDVAQARWSCLHSYAPDPASPVSDAGRAIAAIPQDHWLILQFHSLAEEGFRPLPPAAFTRILETIAQEGVRLVTLHEMVERYKASRGAMIHCVNESR